MSAKKRKVSSDNAAPNGAAISIPHSLQDVLCGAKSNITFPIQISTIYSCIMVTIQDDIQLLSFMDRPEIKAKMSAKALVRYFFPQETDAAIQDIIFRLSITGRNAAEFEKVKAFYYQKRDSREQEAKQQRLQDQLDQMTQTLSQKHKTPLSQTERAEYLYRAYCAAGLKNYPEQFSRDNPNYTKRVETIKRTIVNWETGKTAAPPGYDKNLLKAGFIDWAKQYAGGKKAEEERKEARTQRNTDIQDPRSADFQYGDEKKDYE